MEAPSESSPELLLTYMFNDLAAKAMNAGVHCQNTNLLFLRIAYYSGMAKFVKEIVQDKPLFLGDRRESQNSLPNLSLLRLSNLRFPLNNRN